MNPILTLVVLIMFGLLLAIGWFLFLVLRDSISDYLRDRKYKKEQSKPAEYTFSNKNLERLYKKMVANPSSFEIINDTKYSFYYATVDDIAIQSGLYSLRIGKQGVAWDTHKTLVDGTHYSDSGDCKTIYYWIKNEYDKRLRDEAENRTAELVDEIGLILTTKYIEEDAYDSVNNKQRLKNN